MRCSLWIDVVEKRINAVKGSSDVAKAGLDEASDEQSEQTSVL